MSYSIPTEMLWPGVTEVSLAGETMLTLCAKHVVVVAKAASNLNAATVNFMVVTIGESLKLVGSGSYI